MEMEVFIYPRTNKDFFYLQGSNWFDFETLVILWTGWEPFDPHSKQVKKFQTIT